MPKQTSLNKFITKISKSEEKKSSVSVGNIREILKIVNKELGGKLYADIEYWGTKKEALDEYDLF